MAIAGTALGFKPKADYATDRAFNGQGCVIPSP
jgi:hypothetical protein